MNFETVQLESFVAERIRVHAGHCIPRDEMACLHFAVVRERLDHAIKCMVYEMIAGIHAMPKERLIVNKAWPKTWWDAFKQR